MSKLEADNYVTSMSDLKEILVVHLLEAPGIGLRAKEVNSAVYWFLI